MGSACIPFSGLVRIAEIVLHRFDGCLTWTMGEFKQGTGSLPLAADRVGASTHLKNGLPEASTE